MTTQGQNILMHLDHTPETFICGSNLVPLGPKHVLEIADFFEAVPADRITMSWDLEDDRIGVIITRYFAFVENGGHGSFWFQMQSETDGETVQYRRVRIKLQMQEHNDRVHEWQVEYGVEPGYPDLPAEEDDDGVLEAVLNVARRHLQKRVFVDRDELEKRRAFSQALSMVPAQRFEVPAVYRN